MMVFKALFGASKMAPGAMGEASTRQTKGLGQAERRVDGGFIETGDALVADDDQGLPASIKRLEGLAGLF